MAEISRCNPELLHHRKAHDFLYLDPYIVSSVNVARVGQGLYLGVVVVVCGVLLVNWTIRQTFDVQLDVCR